MLKYFLLFLFLNSITYALVLHEGHEPDYEPHFVNYVYRWGNSGSCVAISPNFFITVRHSGGNHSTVITNGINTFSIKNIYYFGDYDIRLIEVYETIPEYAYLLPPEYFPQEAYVFVCGYGCGRGTPLISYGVVYGYHWDCSVGNTIKRWGTNIVESISNNAYYTSTFSVPEAEDFTDFECSLANYDSGCGIFKLIDGKYYVLGLGKAVTYNGYVIFRASGDPNIPVNTRSYFMNLKDFSEWIFSKVHQECDFNRDFQVDILDLLILNQYWLSTEDKYDLNGDGAVNLIDFSLWRKCWLEYLGEN